MPDIPRTFEPSHLIEAIPMTYPTDPDLLAALTHARACEEQERNAVLKTLALMIFSRDPVTARLMVGEISPALRVLTWIPLCQVSMEEEDVNAGLEAVGLYEPEAMKLDRHPSFIPLTHAQITTFFEIVRACIKQHWTEARRLTLTLDRIPLFLDAAMVIARLTDESDDTLMVYALEMRLDRDINSERISINDEPAFEPPPRDRDQKRTERSARLKKLLRLNSPLVILSRELCLLAEAGGVKEVLDTAAQLSGELYDVDEWYPESLGIGYAIIGEIDTARQYADQLTDPARKARVLMHIYASKIGN